MISRLASFFACRRIFLLFPLLCFCSLIQAQITYEDMILDGSYTFSEIQKVAEEHFADRDKGRGSGYKQWKRWESEMMDRQNPDGTVSDISKILMQAKKYNESHFQSDNTNRSLTGLWENLGPTKYTQPINAGAGLTGIGRLNCIAFHETNPDIIYVGAPAGGFWKTTDGGVTWEPKMQDLAQIGVSGIAVENGDIFVLTGDGDGQQTSSTGVYKSTDGGETFSLLPLPWDASETVFGFKILHHPTYSNTFFIATSTGLYVTIDDGATWNLEFDGPVTDVEVQPSDPNNIIIAGRDNPGNAFIAQTFNFSGSYGPKDYLNNNSQRIEIAVSPDNPTIGYALEGAGFTAPFRFGGFTRWNNADITDQTNLTNTPNIMGGHATGQNGNDQHTYDIAMIVNPNDDMDILTGGIDIWGSTNGGSSWSSVAHWIYQNPLPDNSIVHADIHALELNPLDGKLYCASDGGIHMSTDFGDSWIDLSEGLSISMIYRMDGIDSDFFSYGMQDNGTYSMGLDEEGLRLGGGDGMDTKINPNNQDSIYFSTQNGNLRFTPDGGVSNFGINVPGATGGAWTTPIEILPNDFNTIYAGYQTNLYWSTNTGVTWNTSSPGIGNNNFRFIYAEETSTTIYASSNKLIFSSPVSGMSSASWIDITYNLSTALANPGVNITSITKAGIEVYVTLSGGSAGNKVYFLPEGSTNWNNISFDLPNISVNCIERISDGSETVIYVGTDAGVYRRSIGESQWFLFNQGIPLVSIRDLEADKTNDVIFAATFGRGLYRSGLYGTCTNNEFLTEANDPTGNFPVSEYIKSGNKIESTRKILNSSTFSVQSIYQGGERVVLKPGFRAQQNVFFKATSDNNCSYTDPDS